MMPFYFTFNSKKYILDIRRYKEMTTFYILLAVAICAFLVFTIMWSRERPLLSFMLKGIATISVITLGVYTAINVGLGTIGILLIAGLAFCMLGDLVLALLEIFDETKRENVIKSGETAFALAQVVFIALLALIDTMTLFGLIAGVVIAGVIYLVRKPMKLDFGTTTIPTLLYSALLGANVVGSIILCITSGFAISTILLALGFIFFIISDLILSKIYFGGVRSPIVQKINLFVYYVAITLIASCFIAL